MSHDEWYTPKEIIEPIRKFYGGIIDYDPASCKSANATIQACSYETKGEINKPFIRESGFLNNLWLNPPYCNGAMRDWLELARDFSIAYPHKQIIALVNRSDASWYYDFIYDHIHWQIGGYYQFRKRIKFVDGNSDPGNPKPSSPRYQNDLIYFGKNKLEFSIMCHKEYGLPVPHST